MTFDESNAKITEHLTGKTIDYVVRNGKVLELYTTCGHCVMLQADTKHDIHFKGQSANIILSPLSIGSTQGKF